MTDRNGLLHARSSTTDTGEAGGHSVGGVRGGMGRGEEGEEGEDAAPCYRWVDRYVFTSDILRAYKKDAPNKIKKNKQKTQETENPL